MFDNEVLDITEVAARTGLRASTLRYYDEIGLIRSVGRQGLRRLFAANTVWRLGLIRLGKQAGFSLDEIAAMVDRTGARGLPRDTVKARARSLDAQIRDLEVLRDLLDHVADCPAKTHDECPAFREIIRHGLEDRTTRARPTAPT